MQPGERQAGQWLGKDSRSFACPEGRSTARKGPLCLDKTGVHTGLKPKPYVNFARYGLPVGRGLTIILRAVTISPLKSTHFHAQVRSTEQPSSGKRKPLEYANRTETWRQDGKSSRNKR